MQRNGFEFFPPEAGSLEHPFTTTNFTLLKDYIRIEKSRNLSITNEDEFFITISEYFPHGNHIDDYNATFDKKTGWLISFENKIRFFSGTIQGEVKHSVVFEQMTATPLDSLLQILLISILLAIVLTLSFILRKKYRLRGQLQTSLISLLESKKSKFLHEIYHKVVLGFENVKSQLLSDFPDIQGINKELTSQSPPMVITDIFPQNMQNEITSEIRGRTVLVLVELAYQPSNHAYLGYIAKVLNIPRQSASFELKRLTKLGYIQNRQEYSTLQDVRFKYYELTQKGILFLYLLKETLAYSLIQAQINN
ncbi:MAG: hypothetical protein ACW967_04110 [Candidatus Hodarchaeales archaeon]